jgi:arginine decarboxylase
LTSIATAGLARGFFLPSSYFLAAGAGDASAALVAFDRALLSVGLGNINLIRLSSILPPGLKRTPPIQFQPGAFVGAAYATLSLESAGDLISAAVAVAHPLDDSRESIIMEHAAMLPAKDVESRAIDMARAALESRNLPIKDIETVKIEHKVQAVGRVFAAVFAF